MITLHKHFTVACFAARTDDHKNVTRNPTESNPLVEPDHVKLDIHLHIAVKTQR